MQAVASIVSQTLGQHLEAVAAARLFLLAQPDDDEALHGLRVSIRRLRSALRPLRRYLAQDPAAVAALQLLKQLHAATNPLRDHEVQAQLIERLLLPAWLPAHAAWFNAREQQSRAARGTVLSILAEGALPAALEGLAASLYVIIADPACRLKPAMRRERRVLQKRVLRVTRRLDWVMRREARWHALRLDCKRLRYLIEGYGGLAGKVGTGGSAVIKEAQDALGRWHDLDLLSAGLVASELPVDQLTPLLSAARLRQQAEARLSLKALHRELAHL
ncbi:CHAD domain-containing protein [Chitinimonas naiadis]